MEQEKDTVRCLALPIAGEQILVPNAVVAEVVAADTVSPVRNRFLKKIHQYRIHLH